jgi:hypothetical protein
METFVETTVRLPSISVLPVSRSLELRIGLRAELAALIPLPLQFAEHAKIDASHKRRVIYNSIERFCDIGRGKKIII